jgi:hypothetical protein
MLVKKQRELPSIELFFDSHFHEKHIFVSKLQSLT